MKLEWRLKQLLEQHNLYRYGVESKIAKDCGLHRHTVGKFFRNQAQSPKIDVLEKICGWLVERGVPADTLPGALFGIRPSGLWQAIGQSQKILIFLGEYHLQGRKFTHPQISPSISRHDAVVSSKIIHFLYSEAELQDVRPAVKMLCVPFHFTPDVVAERGFGFEKDKEHSCQLFKDLRKDKPKEWSVIMIGSQRVNYLVECWVAELFSCTPFALDHDDIMVPFYLCYRDFDHLVPSCFGGPGNPPGKTDRIQYGTYYLDHQFQWQLLEWREKTSDAGVVIIVREASNVEMAVFGFSGRATNAIGTALVQHSEKFWPDSDGAPATSVTVGEKEIGIYLCQVTFNRDDAQGQKRECDIFELDKVTVTPLDHNVLEKYFVSGRYRQRFPRKVVG